MVKVSKLMTSQYCDDSCITKPTQLFQSTSFSLIPWIQEEGDSQNLKLVFSGSNICPTIFLCKLMLNWKVKKKPQKLTMCISASWPTKNNDNNRTTYQTFCASQLCCQQQMPLYPLHQQTKPQQTVAEHWKNHTLLKNRQSNILYRESVGRLATFDRNLVLAFYNHTKLC
jgi:hypothetical protein